MNNEASVKAVFNKIKKDLTNPKTKAGKAIIDEGKKICKDAIRNVYNDSKLKKSLETVVLKNDDKTVAPIIAHIDTELEVIEGAKDLHMGIKCKSDLEADIIKANSGGTGLRVRQDMINYLKDKTSAAAAEDQEDTQSGLKMTKYHFDPSNALVKIEKRFEREIKKKAK